MSMRTTASATVTETGGEVRPTAATSGAAAMLPSPSPSISFLPPTPVCSQMSTTVTGDDGAKRPVQELAEMGSQGRALSPPNSNMAEHCKGSLADDLRVSNAGSEAAAVDGITNEVEEAEDHTNQDDIRGKKREIVEFAGAGPESEPKRMRIVGLKNLGNTCYNNAVIQALSHTTSLREYFIERAVPEALGPVVSQPLVKTAPLHSGRPRTRREARLQEQLEAQIPVDINLCNEFSKLLRSMWGVETPTAVVTAVSKRRRRTSTRLASVVSPDAFAGAVSALLPLFQERYEQQDAQEFLRCALEQMHLELKLEKEDKTSMDTENTIVNHVFGGVLWNKISCLSCCKYTIKADPFLDLSLVIPEGRTLVTLEDCIDLFSLSEELEATASATPSTPASPSNRYCLACGSEQGFSQSIKLGELPRVLCIHLKRFRWKRNCKQKVDTLVRFPLQGLDMSRWLGNGDENSGQVQQQLYELYTVVVHQGNGANSGHYFAYVKDHEQWWSLNDERASRVQPEQVLKAKAYLLFYRPQEAPCIPTTTPSITAISTTNTLA